MQKKKLSINKLFPILLTIATLFMGIGYATVNSVVLDINGSAMSKNQTGVFITKIDYQSDVNANVEESTILTTRQTMLNSYISLSKSDPNSSITFQVTVYNSSDEIYYFDGVDYLIDETTYSNEDIVFNLNGLSNGYALNPKEFLTFNITFSYKNNVLANDNTLSSYLNFAFKRKFTINYELLPNYANYPTEVYEGDELVIDLTEDNPYDVRVYSEGTIYENYTYQNKILTIRSVPSNLVIRGVTNTDVDIPVTENDTNFIIVDDSNGEPINVRDLFDMTFSGVNGASKVINRIVLTVVYSSSTGSNQQIYSELTHNGEVKRIETAFRGKMTNATLTLEFNNLNIKYNDTFAISNTNLKLTNGNIEIHSETLNIYFADA